MQVCEDQTRQPKQAATMHELTSAARQVMNYMKEHPNRTLEDHHVRSFVRYVYDSAKAFEAAGKGDDGEAAKNLDGFQRLLERVQEDTTTIRKELANKKSNNTASAETTSIWRDHQAQEWQQALRSASAPKSQGAGSATLGVTQVELGMDCEVIVKIRDEPFRTDLRKSKAVDIVRRAEKSRAEAARSNSNLTIAAHAFIAARQLPSGDISLRASSAAAAEVLRIHAAQWVKEFGDNAWVRVPTWGIVVDGILSQSMKLDVPGAVDSIKRRLVAENQHTWGNGEGGDPEIAYLGWLTKPRRREGSLVIEFTNPLVANQAIARGTIWQMKVHTNRPYCREGRCKQCQKCQNYGHVLAQCPDKTFTCGTCAQGHPTWECPGRQGKEVTIKCANCGGPHKVISSACEHRQKELARAKVAIMNQEDYHRVPNYLKRKDPATSESSESSVPTRAQAAASATAAPQKMVTLLSNPVALGDLAITKPPKRRGRPPKSISSTNEEPVLPENRPIEDMISVSQSTATRSQAATSQYNPLSDPERLLRTQRTQPKPLASKPKRQRSNGTNDTQQKARPPPIPEDREPELPPLPPISLTVDENEVVLHSETSFREANMRTQSSEVGYLLAQFTKNRRPVVSSSLGEISSPPEDLDELDDPPYAAMASASTIESSEDELHA